MNSNIEKTADAQQVSQGIKPKAIRYEAITVNSYWATAEKASANIVPIMPTKNGKGEKQGGGICRIYGSGGELALINKVAIAACEQLTNGTIDVSIFKGQKSYPDKKLAGVLGVV